MRSPLDLIAENFDPGNPESDSSQASGIISLREFMAEKVPEPPQVLFGVMRSGQIGIISSGSKAGKTWLMQSLALAVATGRMWLAWKTTPGRVLYIDPELPAYDGQSRMRKLVEAVGLREMPDAVDYWRVKGKNLSIGDIESRVKTRMQETGEPFALIIVDSIYCFGGGRDENDNAEQAKTMQELYRLSEATGAAIMLSHHFSKGNQAAKNEIDRMSGAGVFARAPDAILVVTELEEPACYRVQTTVRSFAKPKEFSIRWEYPLWSIDETLDEIPLLSPKNRQQTAAQKRRDAQIALLSADAGLKNGEWEEASAARGLVTSHATWKTDVEKMKEDKRVAVRDGVYFRAK